MEPFSTNFNLHEFTKPTTYVILIMTCTHWSSVFTLNKKLAGEMLIVSLVGTETIVFHVEVQNSHCVYMQLLRTISQVPKPVQGVANILETIIYRGVNSTP